MQDTKNPNANKEIADNILKQANAPAKIAHGLMTRQKAKAKVKAREKAKAKVKEKVKVKARARAKVRKIPGQPQSHPPAGVRRGPRRVPRLCCAP